MDVTAYFNDTITVARQTGITAGDPTFGAQTTMKARVERKRGTTFRSDGTETAYDHKVATTSELFLNDRVWLPGANTADANAAVRPINSRFADWLTGRTGYYLTYF